MNGFSRWCEPPLALALAALLATLAGESAEATPHTLRGRLLPVGPSTQDWRVVVAPRLFAELPPPSTGLRVARPRRDGSFSVAGVGDGRRFVCAYLGTRLDVESVVPVRLSPGTPSPQVTLKPNAPRSEVRIVLKRPDGQPLGQTVKVHLYNAHGEVDVGRGGFHPDDAGEIRIQRLPATRYVLWVEPTAARGVPGVRFRNLLVTPGSAPQTFSLTVPGAGGIRGRLVLHDGKTPAAGYTVAVLTGTIPEKNAPASGWPAAYARGARECYAECRSDAHGIFVLSGLTPGNHLFDIRRPGRREPWCTTTGFAVAAGRVADVGDVQVAENGWRWLFDRTSLTGWEESDFYGRAEVRIENDRIVLEEGHDMTGITWTGPSLPRIDYEVSLQAMRVAGSDFFCGLTFPVKKDPCTLILGGWGGGVVGLSSLDGMDASENETSNYVEFERRRWYRVRLKVRADRIQAWLDMEKVVDVALDKKEISIRIECEPSKPFGIATWCTTGALRDLRLRKLDPDERG